MSFWPFPKTLLDELNHGLERGPGVELGSGAGGLRDRLAALGIPLLTADLEPPCDVRLDATCLPLRSGRIGLVVAGNLIRHLSTGGRRDLLAESARVLCPGGRMLLLEDDPVGRTAAETNYREALELLARAQASRGAAVDLPALLETHMPDCVEVVWSTTLENEERPRDPLAPANWLVAHAGLPADELAAHRRRVAEHGMEYGRFQVCVLRRSNRRQ